MEKSLNNVKKLVDTMGKILRIIGKIKVTGEDATSGETNTFTFDVLKLEPYELSHKVITPHFTFPNARVLFGNNVTSWDVIVEVTDFV